MTECGGCCSPGQGSTPPLRWQQRSRPVTTGSPQPGCVTCHVSRGRVSITITMPSLKLCISRGSTTTSPAQLGGGSQLGQAANNNNHCWQCYTRCSAPGLNGLFIDLDAREGTEAVLDECFIISSNVFICSCVCNCMSINIRSYIH